MRGYSLKDLQAKTGLHQKSDSLDRILTLILPDLLKVEECIKANIDSSVHLMREVSNYLLERGGKRLRPSILLLIARLGGYQGDRSIRLATAIEYIHTATLLHDDIIDNSKTRRGYPSANFKWGNEVSVLVGDYLYSKAITIFTEDNEPALLSLLAETTLRMTEGEIMQIERRGDTSLSEDDYFEILRLKTARLIRASAKTGAYLGSFSKAQVESIANFSEKIGIAFQLVDDTLDFLADNKEWGKPVGKDFKEGNLTLPVIHLLTQVSKEDRKWLDAVIAAQNFEDETIRKVYELLVQHDVFKYCFSRAEKFLEEGKYYLAQFPDTPEFSSLLSLADFFIHRVY